MTPSASPSPNAVHAFVVEFLSDPAMVIVTLCWGAVFYALYIQYCNFQDNLRIEHERRVRDQLFDHEEYKLIEKTAILDEITRQLNSEIEELKQILEATPEEATVENSEDEGQITDDSVSEESIVEEDSVGATATPEVPILEGAAVEDSDDTDAFADVPVEKTEEAIPEVLAENIGQPCFNKGSCIPDATKPEPTSTDLPREKSISDFVFIEYQNQKLH